MTRASIWSLAANELAVRPLIGRLGESRDEPRTEEKTPWRKWGRVDGPNLIYRCHGSDIHVVLLPRNRAMSSSVRPNPKSRSSSISRIHARTRRFAASSRAFRSLRTKLDLATGAVVGIAAILCRENCMVMIITFCCCLRSCLSGAGQCSCSARNSRLHVIGIGLHGTPSSPTLRCTPTRA